MLSCEGLFIGESGDGKLVPGVTKSLLSGTGELLCGGEAVWRALDARESKRGVAVLISELEANLLHASIIAIEARDSTMRSSEVVLGQSSDSRNGRRIDRVV